VSRASHCSCVRPIHVLVQSNQEFHFKAIAGCVINVNFICPKLEYLNFHQFVRLLTIKGRINPLFAWVSAHIPIINNLSNHLLLSGALDLNCACIYHFQVWMYCLIYPLLLKSVKFRSRAGCR
jgi:hypothetical protein